MNTDEARMLEMFGFLGGGGTMDTADAMLPVSSVQSPTQALNLF